MLFRSDKAVSSYPSVNVTSNQAKRFCNGNELDLKRVKIKESSLYYRVYAEGEFLGLGEIKGDSLKPKVVF